MPVPASFEFSTEQEFGLQLPNGEQRWAPDNFHGTGFATADDRAKILEAIRNALTNLGQDVSTLGGYQWVKRPKHTLTINYDGDISAYNLDDPGFVEMELVPDLEEMLDPQDP